MNRWKAANRQAKAIKSRKNKRRAVRTLLSHILKVLRG